MAGSSVTGDGGELKGAAVVAEGVVGVEADVAEVGA